MGQVFSEYFGFPCRFSFHQMLHIHLSSGAGTVGQLVADVPSGLSLTPPQEIRNYAYAASHNSELISESHLRSHSKVGFVLKVKLSLCLTN
jgi:hypothetical protein